MKLMPSLYTCSRYLKCGLGITEYLLDKTFAVFTVYSLSANVFPQIVCSAIQPYTGDRSLILKLLL